MSIINETTANTDSEMLAQQNYMLRLKQHYIQQNTAPKAMVVTYGCQQNSGDSERICGMLEESGCGFCDNPSEADIIIYNTCAIRENAEMRVMGNLGALKHEKLRRPNLIIAVCGCMMQQEHVVADIKKKFKHIDIIFGTHTLHTLPQLIWQVIDKQGQSVNIIDSDGIIIEDIPIRREGSVKASISIMYGCNNFCTYCIVPYVRGRERSRWYQDVIAEVREVAAEGYKEIMFLGQNVNSYGNDSDQGVDFAELLLKAAEVEGIERIRFMTSHPKDFSDRLMHVMHTCGKVCAQLHLPVQSGSNAVLKSMNRKYTAEEYLEKLSKIRALMPDIAITSDIIVGFPTETDEDFEQTIDLIKKAQFDMVYSFIYSKRVGTPAAKLDMALTDEQIHRNFGKLIEVQNEISRQANAVCVGKVYNILAEGESKTDKSVMTGRTSSGKIVNFRGAADIIGSIVPVKITSANTWALKGEII